MFRERKDDGTGYHDDTQDGEWWKTSSEVVEYGQQDDLTDDFDGKLLQLLTGFLPRAESSSSFNKHPDCSWSQYLG